MDKSNNILLDQYYGAVNVNSALARTYIESMEYRNNAFLLNCIALTYRDQALFKKNGNRRKKTIKKHLKLAKQFNDKAYDLNKNCFNVLFLRGTILNHMAQIDDAINCFFAIILVEDLNNPNINCSNFEIEDLAMVQNDSYFQVYNLMTEFYSNKIAKKFLKKYKEGVKNGIKTIYNSSK